MARITTLLLFVVCGLQLFGQNINGRFSSAIYTFERADSALAKTLFVRGYHGLSLNINQGNYSLRTSLNLDNGFSNSLNTDSRLRLYNLFLEARDLFGVATLRLGRQSVYTAAMTGLFDGASLDLKYAGYRLNSFYGGNVPDYQRFELTDKWSNDFVAGAKLYTPDFFDFRFSLAYVNKNFRAKEYTAQRLDEQLNPIMLLIRRNSAQYQYMAAQLDYEPGKNLSAVGKYEFDLHLAKTSKVELEAEYEHLGNFSLSGYFNYREPRVRYNSIFSVFNYQNTTELEGGVGYSFGHGISVQARYGYVTYTDENSSRVSLYCNSPWGTLSYRKNMGYAGELDGISLSTARSFFDGLITPSIGLGYSSYKLSADDEASSVTTVLFGTNIRPFRVLSFDLQGQYLDNKIYQNDMRFLFRLNYWFNTNI